MSHATEELPLIPPGPGTRQSLVLHRFGRPGARPKAYLQASLHADEVPAMMAAHHLLQRLARAAQAGEILGEILLVPFANPIGLAQWANERHLGRHELRGGGNFNRRWPDLEAEVARRIEGSLGPEPAANVAAVRAAIAATLEAAVPRRELESLKLALFRHSATADYVLDLHCDDEALLHLFLLPQHWPDAADLAAELGAAAALLDEDTGGGAFDESNSKLWLGLQRRFPDHPLPPACLAATVELRGQADVSDSLGRQDAEALFRWLQRRGLIAGRPPALPRHDCPGVPLAACQVLRAPAAGILAYRVGLGETVRKGQTLAELIDPAAGPGAARQALTAATDGLVLSLKAHKLVLAGQSVAKIVGSAPLPAESAFALEE